VPKYVQAHLTSMLKIYMNMNIYICVRSRIVSVYLPRRLEAAPARADEMLEDCTSYRAIDMYKFNERYWGFGLF
jgi:hypothetical protein